MNNERLSQLHFMLNEEFQKTPIDYTRISEIEYWIGKEFEKPTSNTNFWSYFTLPSDWKLYATAAVGIFIAVNTQLNIVPPNVQQALLVIAGALGIWTVNSTQAAHYENIKALQVAHYENIKSNLMSFGNRMGVNVHNGNRIGHNEK